MLQRSDVVVTHQNEEYVSLTKLGMKVVDVLCEVDPYEESLEVFYLILEDGRTIRFDMGSIFIENDEFIDLEQLMNIAVPEDNDYNDDYDEEYDDDLELLDEDDDEYDS